jgi:hypothetical protein
MNTNNDSNQSDQIAQVVFTTHASSKLQNVFQLEGDRWKLGFGSDPGVLPDSVGLKYVHRLVQNQHKDVHSTQLVLGVVGEQVEAIPTAHLITDVAHGCLGGDSPDSDGGEAERGELDTAEFQDEFLTDEDRGWVIQKLEQEQEALVSLRLNGRVSEIADKEWEISEIQKYLNKTRLRRKNLHFPSPSERERKSVAIAIKRAIKKSEKINPLLAKHLRESITTGRFCSYRPNGEIAWVL